MNTRTWSDWSCEVAVTTVRERDLGPAVSTVRAVMGEVEVAASRFRDDSDLSRVNRCAGRFVTVAPMTLTLVGIALDAAERTRGAVTPTIGGALRALGYDDDIERVRARPDAPACTALPVPAVTVVRVDRHFGRVGVTSGTLLDLGALAKPYAVDEAVRRIAPRAEGGFVVSIGGDLAVHGGSDWAVSVSEASHDPAEHVAIDEGALATSSTRTRRWAGGRHHIIDPRSGMPANGRLRTATVWAPTAVEANLLSTWLLVDPAAGQDALGRGEHPARLVDVDGVVERRHGWPAGEAVASGTAVAS